MLKKERIDTCFLPKCKKRLICNRKQENDTDVRNSNEFYIDYNPFHVDYTVTILTSG